MLTETQVKKFRTTLKQNYNARLRVLFNALGDPCRFLIFQLLLLQKEVCVTDVAKICNHSVSAASQQLKVLELTGMVEKKRQGQMVCYRLKENDPMIKTLIKIMP